ncbi:ParB/RepB/Spo0J family partition protein [Sphingomonas sp. ERG5]|uniref:ParB/RepB/Spo0J family partition protein n=1 Tax=Sphingomonas sp. ERG5 TaxID=1381597 RepID=UPI00054BEE0B|nr:ParB N-terminal domain-containing protein [Sphingomonas sp. ERG5]
MKLDFIPLDKLCVSRANMRSAKKPPDVSDLLPSVRKRGVLQPVIVRPNCAPDSFEIVAGWRRFTAAMIVAEERRAAGDESEPMPCAILDTIDDADAIEASLIENIARLDPDEVTQWETFTRLVREGRKVEDIAATFALPDLTVKRVLALGNLLPRIRAMYAKEEIDRATVRHLTLASKSQQKTWLALADDDTASCPTGHQLKAWLFGGQSIPVRHALFDVAASGLVTIADLFGEDRYFADADAFWTAQHDAIEARRIQYLEAGWPDAVIVPPSGQFHAWDYEKAGKRKGGRVYIDVRSSGEVSFHEGYIGRREVERAARRTGVTGETPKRPEVTSAMQTYIDLHRHAAVRAALTGHPGVALRLTVAHLIVGSPLWTVRREPQASCDDATRDSVATGLGEVRFDERRRAVLALLDLDPERATVTGGDRDDTMLVRLLLRLLDLPDTGVMDVIAVAMGETLASGSAAVEAVGQTLGLDMARWWQADPAFFDLIRDKEVLSAMVAEVAGETVAQANLGEKGKTLKRIVTDHLDGAGGRAKVERWVPKWMAFPPATYTARGGVGTVAASARLAAARHDDDPDPTAPEGAALPPDPDEGGEEHGSNDNFDSPEALAA